MTVYSYNKQLKDKLLLIYLIILSLLFTVVLYYVFANSFTRLSLLVLIIIITAILFSFLAMAIYANHLNIRRFRELQRSQKAIISALASLAEWRDPETGHHLERTRHYALLLAKELSKLKKYSNKISNDFAEGMFDAAPLHDIGKVGIPDSILLKEGKLTHDEYEKMKEHVYIGKQVLNSLVLQFKIDKMFFSIGESICAYHHERFDGTGYPYGLKGDDIPIEARIFALCDAYDALRSKRPYKQVVPHEKTVEILKMDSQKHFDPDVVMAFLTCEKDFKELSNMGL